MHEGNYQEHQVYSSTFKLHNDFQLNKFVGVGAYGVVCSARHTASGANVAIKRITDLFQRVSDTKRTLREIMLLRHFNHDNVLQLRNVLVVGDRHNFSEIYLVTDLMDTDLHKIINSNQGLSEDHIQFFLYQILRGLKYLHSANVIHRDLKPSNLLINQDCLIKICDFGMARCSAEGNGEIGMTEYVATRWYRAPEVILSWKRYTQSIDIWSVGCIFAELMGRKPLFKGINYLDQVSRIVEIIGMPHEDDMQHIRSTEARTFLSQQGFKPKIPFQKFFPRAKGEAIDLLSRLLTFDPEKRISVNDALAHVYLKDLHDEKDEPVCNVPVRFDWEDGPDLTPDQYRALFWQEISYYHPELSGNGFTPQQFVPHQQMQQHPGFAQGAHFAQGSSAMEM